MSVYVCMCVCGGGQFASAARAVANLLVGGGGKSCFLSCTVKALHPCNNPLLFLHLNVLESLYYVPAPNNYQLFSSSEGGTL